MDSIGTHINNIKQKAKLLPLRKKTRIRSEKSDTIMLNSILSSNLISQNNSKRNI